MPTCEKRPHMSLDFGLQDDQVCQKQKFRWLFKIDGVSGVSDALPPLKSHRPKLDLREQQIQHLVQQIYYPLKADWKTIQLSLYDIKVNENPVFEWLRVLYDPCGDPEWRPIYQPGCDDGSCFKRNAMLCLYDGCGNVIESWRYENCYPQTIDWGELDMGNSEVVMVDITLRYDRACLQ